MARCRAVDIDEKMIVSSTGALALTKVPGHMVVAAAASSGWSWVGLARLGAKVTVIEYLDRSWGMDNEVVKKFQGHADKQGMDFKLGSKVTGREGQKDGAKVTFEPVKGGDAETLNADIVLVATGRGPTPTASVSRRPGWRWMSAGAVSSMIITQMSRASTPLAM